MAQVEKQIVAAQKFLQNVVALPSFSDLLSKQMQRLQTLLGKTLLSVEQSAALMDVLDSDVWGLESMEKLKTCIAQQTRHDSDDSVAATRASLQDYTSLPYYLSQEWWNVLESGREKVRTLESLCHLAASLGLRNPSEPTYAGFCALVFCSGSKQLLEEEKLKLLALHKARMKKVFNNAVPLASVLDVLPSDVEQCPKIFLDTAYPNGFVAGTPVTQTMVTVCNLVSTYPCRRRGKVSAGESTVSALESPVTKTLSRLASVAKVLNEGRREQGENEVLPGFKLLQAGKASAEPGTASSSRPEPLPLMDAQPADSAALKEVPSEPVHASATVQKLKEQMRKQTGQDSSSKTDDQGKGNGKKDIVAKPVGSSGSPKVSVKKKPAGKVTVCRKPATSDQQDLKRPPKVLCKPAASTHGLKRPAAVQTAGELKRQQVLKLVPPQVLERYKDGCSRCYHRQYCTVSCWARRGYSL